MAIAVIRPGRVHRNSRVRSAGKRPVTAADRHLAAVVGNPPLVAVGKRLTLAAAATSRLQARGLAADVRKLPESTGVDSHRTLAAVMRHPSVVTVVVPLVLATPIVATAVVVARVDRVAETAAVTTNA